VSKISSSLEHIYGGVKSNKITLSGFETKNLSEDEEKKEATEFVEEYFSDEEEGKNFDKDLKDRNA